MINDLKQRAYEQERSENFGRAIELYESVIDQREAEGLTHQDASVFLRIADLHLRRDQDEEAIEAFQRAGELYAREGLQPQAIAVYRRILRIEPAHTEALWNLAWLHAEMGVMAEARQYVADYLQTVDMERDWVEARDFLRRLLDLSEDVAIGLRLAELLEEAGRHEKALEVLERLDVDFAGSAALDEEEIKARIDALREEVVPEDERVEGDVSFDGGEFDERASSDRNASLEEAPGASGAPETEDSSPAPAGMEPDFGGASPDAAGGGFGEPPAEDDELGDEYDLEVDEADAGSLDEGFPFPEAEEANGAFEGDELQEAEPGEETTAPEPEDDGPDYDWNQPEVDATEESPEDEGEGFDEEMQRPPASFGDEVAAGGADSGPEPSGLEDREEAGETSADEHHRDVREEDEEEQMSTQSEDLSGAAVGEDRETRDASDGSGFGRPATGTGRGAGGTSGATDYEDEYGEQAELRRGLDVLDELIELDPDRLDHYHRRVGYAERLEDPGEIAGSWLEMASVLRDRDSSRGARLVYEHVLGLDVDAERARKGIEELDRRAREALDVPELLSDADAPEGPEADRSDLAGRVWAELDRVRNRVQWLRGAAAMLRDDGGDGHADGPPAGAYELAGRYYLARDDVDEAIDVLSMALERQDLDDAELVDVLFQLGLSHYRIDDRGSARKYFDRVASHDEDFGIVFDWVLDEI